MFYESLTYLKQKLEAYILENRKSAEPLIMLSNPWTSNGGSESNRNASFLNALSLINIEEEKIFRTQAPQIVHQKNGMYSKKGADLKLNFYILFSSYNKNYEDSLKFISKVIAFFQQKNIFLQEDDLPLNIEKLVLNLYTANFDQQNQIWATLSTGYLPSVIYKVGMVVIDGAIDATEYKLIHEINTTAG